MLFFTHVEASVHSRRPFDRGNWDNASNLKTALSPAGSGETVWAKKGVDLPGVA